jgi:hypothetical protein
MSMFHISLRGQLAKRLYVFLLSISFLAPQAWAQPVQAPTAILAPVRVWVNSSSGVYHCPATRWYGATKAGTYLSEPQARARGYRPAYGRTCGPLLDADTALTATLRSLAPAPTAGVKVWVNTNSGVYHCPGTRYYGTTTKGKYMSEGEARTAGNRPAYGRACS